MRLHFMLGKVAQLRRASPSLWAPFISGWLSRHKESLVPCVVPGCPRLLTIPLRDFYESYAVFFEVRRGRDELDFFLKRLRPKEVLYDIGAYRGAYSAALKMRLNENASVHVFDPIAGNIASIRKICELNRFTGVKTNQQAVGRGNILAGNVSSDDYMFRAGAARTTDGPTEQTEFSTRSLDDYIAAGETPPTLMKIDVEGFEWEVLQGARGLLAKHRPRLWLEVHPEFLVEQGQSAAAVLDLLRETGYAVSYYDDYYWPSAKATYHVWCE